MKHRSLKLVLFIILCFSGSLGLYAQNNLSGAFMTNSIYYLNDSASGAVAPADKVGSNNYFKLDYRYNKFQAGIQYEAYLPVLQGLPGELHSNKLVMKYATFRDSNLIVTAGDFYDQFGNGLIFRAYEERALGLNTAVEGVNLSYSFRDFVRIKALAGHSREFMEKAESNVKGASLAFNLRSVLKLKRSSAGVELNYINRYLNYTGQDAVNPNVQAYSFKGNWMLSGFTLQGEYAYKTQDRSAYTGNINKDGSALLVEAGYNAPGFGSLFTFRRLEYMQFGTTRGITGIGRDLNYLPALTKQHSYSLANLNPYNTMGNSEIGGQLDIQYRLKKGSMLGGTYGTKISFNASTYYNLKGDPLKGFEFTNIGNTKYYRDINVEVGKRVNNSLNVQLLYSHQLYNPIVIGKENTLYASHISIADLLWQYATERSLRFELQHLWSGDYYKNWAGALIEFTNSSNWTCFVGDMYNYGDTDVHYIKVGGSYTVSRTRIALNYGRNREGTICAGGVCLYMPAYTGLNLSIASAF